MARSGENLPAVVVPELPTLQEIASFKIFIRLFDYCRNNFEPNSSPSEAIATPNAFDPDHDCNLRWIMEWSEVKENIKHNLEGLQLPQPVKCQLLDDLNVIEKNVQLWIMLLFAVSLSSPWRREIIWAKNKTINWHLSVARISKVDKHDELIVFCLEEVCRCRLQDTFATGMEIQKQSKKPLCKPIHDNVRIILLCERRNRINRNWIKMNTWHYTLKHGKNYSKEPFIKKVIM